MTSLTDYPLISMPLVSVVAVAVLSLLVLYLIRTQAHTLIRRVATMLHRMLRITARACLHTEQRMRFRNHEVTKALAEALMERQLERRFLRIEALVEKDLAHYQKLSAEINRQLASIDEDYKASAQVPTAAPQWIDAVDAIASLQNKERNNGEVLNKILTDLHKTVQQHQRDVMREHRWTVNARHKVLAGLQPRWRKLSKMLTQIDHNIESLRLRLHQADQHMGQFEVLTAGTRLSLMGSMFMRFVIALCFVSVAGVAAWINMQLLDQPLAHILTAGPMVELPLVNLVAIAHITITLMAAVMVTESLRITHFFPLMAAMTRRGRYTVTTVGGFLLLAMAAIEAIALASAPGASVAAASAVDANAAQTSVVSQLVLAVLGFVMPIVLALAVVPLEYLLCTVRPVLGAAAQLVLHVVVLALRLVGAGVLELSKLIILAYDVVIFMPLGLETFWHATQRRREQTHTAQDDEEPTLQPSSVNVPNVTALRFSAASRGDKS